MKTSQQVAEQIVFATEIGVERTARVSRPDCDILYTDSSKAHPRDELLRSFDQTAFGLFAAVLSAQAFAFRARKLRGYFDVKRRPHSFGRHIIVIDRTGIRVAAGSSSHRRDFTAVMPFSVRRQWHFREDGVPVTRRR
jgi:hypothetical protein